MNKIHVRYSLLIVFIITCLFGVIINSPVVSAANEKLVDNPCTEVDIVIARGSGQSLRDREYKKIDGSLLKRIQNNGWSVNLYELGTESYGNSKYPAVSIGSNTQKIDAKFGQGNGNYRESVNAGKQELIAYLQERMTNCPDAKYILTGYSQGAHVIGDMLEYSTVNMRSKIAYVAYFGDPRLWLPEGQGIWPAGCRGSDKSPWRRGNVFCFTSGGSLSGRNPYLPSSLVNKTGSWCDKYDYVCTNQVYRGKNNSHSEYSLQNAEIDQASREIAKKIGVKNTNPPALARLSNTLVEDEEPIYVDELIVVASQDEYYLQPGDTAYFDVSQSYYDYGELNSFAWDFDNDGVIDQTTSEPYAQHTYVQVFEGVARVVVTANTPDRRSGEATFAVSVSAASLQERIPGKITNVLATPIQITGELREVTLSWTKDDSANGYFIYIDDAQVATLDDTVNSVPIENVNLRTDTVFKVVASNQFGNGEAGMYTLKGVPVVQPPVDPPAPTQSKACLALAKLKPYLHPVIYKALAKALKCN